MSTTAQLKHCHKEKTQLSISVILNRFVGFIIYFYVHRSPFHYQHYMNNHYDPQWCFVSISTRQKQAQPLRPVRDFKF